MKTTLHLIYLLAILLPFSAFAEGSKQLTPWTTNTSTDLTNPNNTRAGYLAHDANFAAAAGVGATSLGFLKPSTFSRNDATFSVDHRLYVRVKPGERLYYGVRRALHDQGSGNQGDLIITIKRITSTSGIAGEVVQTTTLARNQGSTRNMLLNAAAGVIGTPEQVQVGPNRTGITNGYNPLTFLNPTTGADEDYFIEFTQTGEATMADGQRFSVYDLWDFTVIGTDGLEKPGRLYSKFWSFSAGGANNVFSRDFNMFPLIPSASQSNRFYVKRLSLAGIAPQNFFRFVTNSQGSTTAAGTTIEARRKSQMAQTDYPEYFNFVNNPDPGIWQSAGLPSFSVSVNNYCNTVAGHGGATFSGNSTEQSTFMVLIDLNGEPGYQQGTTDVLLEQTGPAGIKRIDWNGLDGLGKIVPSGTIMKYRFKNGCAPVSFPMWDAETNMTGFKVGDVRPVPLNATFSYNSELYWDDSNLPLTKFPNPGRTELSE